MDDLIGQPSFSDLENGDVDSSEEAGAKQTDDGIVLTVDRTRQTHMAIGMWRELNENASTPSTVLPVSHTLAESMMLEHEPAASVVPKRSKPADQRELAASEKTVEIDSSETPKNKRKRARDNARQDSGGDVSRRRVDY